jgi:tRNA-dihydrouridine synthase
MYGRLIIARIIIALFAPNYIFMHIWLAPMDGITDLAYRIITKQLFQKHWHTNDTLMLWTEFMSAEGYFHNPKWVVKHLLVSDYDSETIAQIFGWDAEALVHTACDIEKKYKFWGIELNMWCPSPKIMKCNAWVGMLKDKKNTLEILKTLSTSLTIPFSLKTRIWLSQDDRDEQFDFLVEASKYVRMIGLHWRTYKQWHSGEVSWEYIRNLKKACPQTLVIGNWWVKTYEDWLEKSQWLDGVMTAQAAIGDPRVLMPHTPTLEEKYHLIRHHLSLSVACDIWYQDHITTYDDQKWLHQPTFLELESLQNNIQSNPSEYDHSFAPVEFRKYLFRYVHWIDESKKFKKQVPPAKTYAQLSNILEEFFEWALST